MPCPIVNGPSGIITIVEADTVAGRLSDRMAIQMKIRYRFIIESLPREQTIIQYLIRKGLKSRALKEEK